MARQLRWKDLVVGLAGLGAVIGLSLVVLLFARVGGVRGPKATIYVTAATARGVLKGTEVMLSGKRIGTVEAIHFLSPETDTLSRLLLEVEVLRNTLPLIRRDAVAHIRPSGTIIGAPVIDIGSGTAAAGPIRAGDTVPARPQAAAERFADRFEMLQREVGGGFTQVRSILADVRGARGTYGAMRIRAPRDVATFRAHVAALRRRVAGEGSAGLAIRDPELRTRVSAAVAGADTLGMLLDSDRGAVGRFRKDTTLESSMQALRAEIAVLSAALAEPRGTAGRLRGDQALANELAELELRLELLTEDVKRNPLRYISF